MSGVIWLLAAAAYASFLAWYVGFGRRISQSEIDRTLGFLAAGGADGARLEALRRFLAEDTGRSFVMVNLLQLARPRDQAEAAFALYRRRFLGRLLRRAGHPVFIGRATMPFNIEQWGIDAEGWDAVGLVRYRSRRDLACMVEYAFADDTREAKHAALQKTFALPVDPWMITGGVSVVVGLSIGLVALALQLALG